MTLDKMHPCQQDPRPPRRCGIAKRDQDPSEPTGAGGQPAPLLWTLRADAKARLPAFLEI